MGAGVDGLTLVVDASEVTVLAGRLADAPRVVGEELLAAGRRSAFLVEGSAKGFAPRDLGNLVNSIGNEVSQDAGGVVAVIRATAEYARYQNDGTGIYGARGTPIVPRRAKLLSWVGKDGVRVFARSVRGVPPQRFMERALAANEARIRAEVQAAAARVAARVAGRG